MQTLIQWVLGGARDSKEFPNNVNVPGPWCVTSINCYLSLFSLAVYPLFFYSVFFFNFILFLNFTILY